jgi:voltage-gated potassium channel
MFRPRRLPSEQTRRRKFLNTLKTLLPVLRIGLIIVVCLFVAAVLVRTFELREDNDQFESFWDGIWWAIVTMTTVGYGDKSPTTGPGQAVAVILMWTSIILISFFTATISSIAVARKIQEGRGLEVVKFKGHTLICGWNNDAPKLLEAWNDADELQVVLINEMPAETMENYLKAYDNLEIRFVRGNFAREPILSRANVQEATAAIILPDAASSVGSDQPDDTQTLEATIMIKDMAPNVKVYAHVLDADRVANLRRAEIDDVVISDEHTGHLLATHVTSPGTPQVIQELLLRDNEHHIQRVEIPDEFVGRRFDELFNYFRQEKHLILLGYIVEDEGFRLQEALSGGNAAIVDFITREVQHAGISTTTKGSIQVNLNPPDDHIIEKGAFAIVVI